MSYDLRIWSEKAVRIPEDLPVSKNWKRYEGTAAWEEKTWQVSVTNSSPAEGSDLPETEFPQLKNARFVCDVNLEPIGAPQEAYEKLDRVARHLAARTNGVVEDRQQGIFYDAKGQAQTVQKNKTADSRFSVLMFSWWFNDSPLLHPGGISNLLGILEKTLPEAMPYRYGLFEPLSFKLEEKGRSHFVDFFEKNHLGSGFAERGNYQNLLWNPKPPALFVHCACDPDWGWEDGGERKKYRSNRFEVELDAAVLETPGAEIRLTRFWKAVSEFLQPFYGDVRVLENYKRSGRHFQSDGLTDEHPVVSWWWAGIPSDIGQAAVLGPPYTTLWPGFVKHAEKSGDLYFVASSPWVKKREAIESVGKPPTEIAAVEELRFLKLHPLPTEPASFWAKLFSKPPRPGYSSSNPTKYPAVFPFEREAPSEAFWNKEREKYANSKHP